jgi:hypothetical protein
MKIIINDGAAARLPYSKAMPATAFAEPSPSRAASRTVRLISASPKPMAISAPASGRSDRRPARSGPLALASTPSANEIGFAWTPTMTIGSGCKVHLRESELPMGRLVANVRRRSVAVIDGVIHGTFDDQARRRSVCLWILEASRRLVGWVKPERHAGVGGASVSRLFRPIPRRPATPAPSCSPGVFRSAGNFVVNDTNATAPTDVEALICAESRTWAALAISARSA